MKTGHAPKPAQCALGKLIPQTIDTEELKNDAWIKHRILVVAADDPRIGWIERQIIEQIGEKLYRDRRAPRG